MSQGRFLFVPDTVPPKMFMFIGFFLARKEAQRGRKRVWAKQQGRRGAKEWEEHWCKREDKGRGKWVGEKERSKREASKDEEGCLWWPEGNHDKNWVLRRVLKRFWGGFSEGFLEGGLPWVLQQSKVL